MEKQALTPPNTFKQSHESPVFTTPLAPVTDSVSVGAALEAAPPTSRVLTPVASNLSQAAPKLRSSYGTTASTPRPHAPPQFQSSVFYPNSVSAQIQANATKPLETDMSKYVPDSYCFLSVPPRDQFNLRFAQRIDFCTFHHMIVTSRNDLLGRAVQLQNVGVRF